MINRCCNFSDLLIATDQFLQKIPVVRNIVAIINLIMKRVLQCIPKQYIRSNKYFFYLCNKASQAQNKTQNLSLALLSNKGSNKGQAAKQLPLGSFNPPPQLPLVISKLKLEADEINQAVFFEGNKNLSTLPNPEAYVTYRGLSDDRRQQCRQHLYETLFPLIKDKEISLSCISGYQGESLFVSVDVDKKLIFRGVLPTEQQYTISVNSTGYTEYQLDDKWFNLNIKLLNETELTFDTDNFEIKHNTRGGEAFYKKGDSGQLCSVEKQYHIAPAMIELITMKLNQIEVFLKSGSHGVAEQVFQSCQSIFNQIGNLTLSKPATGSTLALNSIEEEVLELGPMVSPMNSQDSTFTWKIAKTKEDTSLSFEKKAQGRGFHQSSQRNLILTKSHTSQNTLKVTIIKGDSSDVHDSETKTVYTLKMKNGTLLVLPEEKIVSACYNFPFMIIDKETNTLEGIDPYMIDSSAEPTALEIKQDIEWVIKSLTTVGDIFQSPHTLILPENDEDPVYNLQGQDMPKECLRQRVVFDQGIDGYNALAWNVSGLRMKTLKTLHGKPVAQSLTLTQASSS